MEDNKMTKDFSNLLYTHVVYKNCIKQIHVHTSARFEEITTGQ